MGSSEKKGIISETKETSMFQKIFPKFSKVLEYLFEKVATSNSVFCDPFNIGGLAYLIVIFMMISNMAHMDHLNIPKDDNIRYFYIMKVICIVPLFYFLFDFMFSSTPCSVEYRRHFTEIAPDEIKSIQGMIYSCFIYTIIAVGLGFTEFDVLTITGYFIVLIIVLTICFKHNQRSTKLRTDINETINNYVVAAQKSKDKGSVVILESTLLKATLKNIGAEPWHSSYCEFHRHIQSKNLEECIKISLPEFTLLPKQQIDLIPENHPFDGDCIRVPHLHCFGTRIDSEVITIIAEAKEKILYPVETLSSQFCYPPKIAEHVANYKRVVRSEWTNERTY